MKIAVYARQIPKNFLPAFWKMIEALNKTSAEVVLHSSLANQFKKGTPKVTLPQFAPDFKDCDYLICIGGDGTLLDTVVILKDKPIPVIGINIGRLGFLANTSISDIEGSVEDLVKGRYSIERRTLLELKSDTPLFDYNFALNDFVIHKKDSSSMITIHTYINGEFLNSYWSDGLIISTPTGSTGYSLSCGGPIIFPTSANLAITPIAPHNLNVRPIIVSDEDVISFDVEGRTSSFLASLDARSLAFDRKTQIAVKKAPYFFQLVKFNGDNFLNTLRNKLMWGIDHRN